jgi:tetratricopeptide (TPR) repeat protein
MENIQLLEELAIDAAINSNWNETIKLNDRIIKADKNNISAYLRLGFAHLQLGQWSKAKKYYKKALGLQPGNNVASENLERIKVLETKAVRKKTKAPISLNPNLFLEVPGKTKSVVLVNLGQKDILAQLTIGQEIVLIQKKRRIEARTKNKEYVGSLPDDISKRLIIFIKAGSKYLSLIKEASLNKVVIFIREERKGRKVLRYTSFPRNIQANLNEITHEGEVKEEEAEEVMENDIDKLAEVLTTEEKEYIPYEPEEEEEESEE